MDIPHGYKQTEVGVIPNDWEVITARDACTKIQDGTHFSPKLGGNDYLYITSKNIRFGFIDLSSAGRITESQHRIIYKRCDVKYGDLLLTKDGANTGNAALNTLNEEFSLLSSVAFLRFDPKKYSTGYFLQQILSHQGQKQIQNAMVGNAITRLTLEKINKLCFAVPPTKAEQTAIAAVLNDADALLAALETLLAKKRNIKQGAMQVLLQPQAGWETKKLGEIAEIKDGTHQTPQYCDSGIPFYSVENVTANDFTNTKFISQEEHNFLTKNWRIEKGDILMTRIGSIGDCKYVDWDVNASFYVSLALLKVKKEFSAKFISQYSKCSFFKKEIEMNSLLFAYPKKINLGQISKVKVVIPKSIEEQIRIARILTDMDAEIAALEQQLAKYRMIKQGLMQNLLTGKKRLNH